MPDFIIPPELIEHLTRGDCVLFLGADLPYDVTSLPARADLARDMARRYRLDESPSLAEVAQRVSQAGNRFEFTDFIRSALDTTGKSPSAFHHSIVALVKKYRIETMITTAYDNLLEVAFQQAGVGFNRVVRGSDVSFTRPERPTLIKFYGDAQQPDTLVVTDRDHSQLLRDRDKEDVVDEVRRAFKRNTILFYGYNLSDPDFKFLFDQIAESKFARLAYAVWPGLSQADVRMWRDRGIVILDEDPREAIDGTLLGSLTTVTASVPKSETVISRNTSPESTSTTMRSGGVDIQAKQIELDGDIVGRDKVVSAGGHIAHAKPKATQPQLEVQTLRVDAAVPEQVFVDRVFDLAVAVRQITSPLLAVKDLTHIESGEVLVVAEQGTPVLDLRAEVDAPDCAIVGKSSIQFQLVRGKDAPPIYFHLRPQRAGDLSIVVTIYQAEYVLGSARVSTLAAEQMTRSAGKVQLTVTSQPLWLDCELRIFDLIDHEYRVELTLNGEQVFRGAAQANLATWTATGDAVADGQTLFKILLDDDELLKAWGEARGRSKQRRVRLRIDPPALHVLPWELLRDRDELIAADADTPFSRYLAIGKEWGRALSDRSMPVLAVISNPIDLTDKYNLPPADVELEEKTLREALSSSPIKGEGWGESVSLTFLSAPITLARLEAELRNGYHVLHFIGHGGFSVKQQQAALYFENEDRTTHRVIDTDFAGMLDRLQTPPQLVALAACQSATQSLYDVFTGLAPRLVQIGLPAVVAMHADVTMLTARQFAATFYRQLFAHGTVDLAMNEARSMLITNGRFDAAAPVLFMRLRDGRLWEAAARAAPSTPIEPPLPIGRAALSQEDRASLERQLADLRENLQVIEEHKAKYVQEIDVPLQYLKEERRLRATIADLEARLRGS
ncbi:MAG TPA: CHAT domain-containing protein [Anaerolineae bacterium]|nr:CHAT domain-containing protein [Anaerolineae bacterium]